jgi:hypothetical protein
LTWDNEYDRYAVSLRKQVFAILDKNPLYTPLDLAEKLKISFKRYQQTLANYKQDWKHTHDFERGSTCSQFHCVRWGLWERVEADRGLAVQRNWLLSKARNRFLVFKSVLGRVVWFETGTVRLHVRSPGNEGKAKQLFCDGFFKTELISADVLEKCLGSLFLDSFHTVVETKQRLPYVHVRDFADTNGFEFKSGDRSNPRGFEFIVHYQSQFERARLLFEDVAKSLGQLGLNGQVSNGVSSQAKDVGVV